MAILSLHKELTDAIELVAVGNEFISKRLNNFKQSLIYTWLNFQNDGFDSKFYFLVETQQHYIKQFGLKLHSSLNNVV